MNGSERIAAERKRQIDVEGYTPEHDAKHEEGDLLFAAYSYVLAANASRTGPGTGSKFLQQRDWPWEPESWRPSDDPIRNLEKAGALIAAEIDRLLVDRWNR